MTARLTARGWTVVVCTLLCWALGLWAAYPAIIGLAAALSAALLVAVATVAVPTPVRVSRTVQPARVARYDECRATIRVENTARRWRVSLSGTDRVDGAPVVFDFPPLSAGEHATTTVRIPTERRGLIEFGPLTLDRRSFADLIRVRRAYGEAASVLVEPRVLDVIAVPPGMRRGHAGAEERIAHGGTDLVGMREYVPGDDLRRLHWATSARRGQLMVREDADPAQPFLTVLLDDRAGSYREGGLDEAVDLAASLLDAAAVARSPARLVTVSGALDLELPVEPGRVDAARVAPTALAALATLIPHASSERPRLQVSSPDVVAVVSGADADAAALVLTAAAAPAGVVAVVDPAPERLLSASGAVLVLRGPRAEELAHGWRAGVAGAGTAGVGTAGAGR
ncbi:DUF58 domain-containing protein [Microbacterium sp. ARD32]|uniref:DUF58 domain-containing protein n=1 Tax=Microbacterium sp. ARD32 TaxID=2962577 RepID=UPI002881AF06|nr:DUF58 domain-containing protein [Microbacterium sp. ARD32]MDT0157719.1 DUF58 domain-containing protein [Microbacterium sp. ARD32]